MAGIDSLKNAIPGGIGSAPTFVVLKNGVEKGRFIEDPKVAVDTDIASFFAVQ
jgi:hypothetical protein